MSAHLSETESQNLTAMEEAVIKTRQDLWLHKQARAKLAGQIPNSGPWVMSYIARRAIYLEDWRENRKYCYLRGGCCERGCGCCRKPRRTDAGKTTICWDFFWESTKFSSHCTVECGCCRRERGFKLEDQLF